MVIKNAYQTEANLAHFHKFNNLINKFCPASPFWNQGNDKTLANTFDAGYYQHLVNLAET